MAPVAMLATGELAHEATYFINILLSCCLISGGWVFQCNEWVAVFLVIFFVTFYYSMCSWGLLLSLTPCCVSPPMYLVTSKTIYNNAQPGTILYISSRQGRLLLGNWLQLRFIMKLRTNFSQQFSCKVSIFILLWMEGNTPLGQDKVCSTEKDVPQTQSVGAWREGNHNARPEHPGKQSYAVLNHAHQGEELLAKLMQSNILKNLPKIHLGISQKFYLLCSSCFPLYLYYPSI